MHPSYDDITGRIAERPSWWQTGGVPRYGEFSPDRRESIYADEIALVEIACQGCDARFHVAFDRGVIDRLNGPSLADEIRSCTLHYGDPPNTGCCPAGPTMNSEPIAVLQYWSRNDARHVGAGGVVTDVENYMEWRRDPLLEGPFA